MMSFLRIALVMFLGRAAADVPPADALAGYNGVAAELSSVLSMDDGRQVIVLAENQGADGMYKDGLALITDRLTGKVQSAHELIAGVSSPLNGSFACHAVQSGGVCCSGIRERDAMIRVACTVCEGPQCRVNLDSGWSK